MNKWRDGLLAAVLVAAAFPAEAQVLPSTARYKHLGVATCASSVCHGKSTPSKTADVWLTEYSIWSHHDQHAKAYTVLSNQQSQTIARKLGLKSATTAKVCLACHTDDVPPKMRGPKFQLSDGVGCEACHGGAQNWIESHTARNRSRKANLDAGMYPTANPKALAKLCVSCHVGSDGRFANHDLMAAGHPRLGFDLQTFTVNEPPHYHVDKDYIARKGEIGPVTRWATGQMYKARQELQLMQTDLFTGHGMFPELAFFECHACHHPMNDVRWSPTRVTAGLPIGVVRLDVSSLQMLIAVTSVVAPVRSRELIKRTDALNRATTQSKARTLAVAASLDDYLKQMTDALVAHKYTAGDDRAIRQALLQNAKRGEYRDFATAEQAFLAVETLSIQLGQDRLPVLNQWFGTVQHEARFSPSHFAYVAGQFSKQLQ